VSKSNLVVVEDQERSILTGIDRKQSEVLACLAEELRQQ
jgi:hypothetical protein